VNHHTRSERQKETTPTYRYEYQKIFGRKPGEKEAPKPDPSKVYRSAKRGA
jgi:hypothetical protein